MLASGLNLGCEIVNLKAKVVLHSTLMYCILILDPDFSSPEVEIIRGETKSTKLG